MARAMRQPLRKFVRGWPTGEFADTSPSDGNITINSTVTRNGNPTLRVNAQSGVNSSLQMNVPGSTMERQWHRFYLYVVSRPATARTFYRTLSASVTGGAMGIVLNPNGTLSLVANGTTIWTGSDAIPLNTWTCVEAAYKGDVDYAALRINGVQVMPWTVATGMTGAAGDFYVGALDTVAAAFEIRLTDHVMDANEWPGPGKTIALFPNATVQLPAGFTLGGSSPAATAHESVDDATADDAVTYVESNLTSGSELHLGFDALPAGVTPLGLMAYARVKRADAAAGNASFTLDVECYSQESNSAGLTGLSTWAWFTNAASDPTGGTWTVDHVNDMTLTYTVADTTDRGWITAARVEVDVVDDATDTLVSVAPSFVSAFSLGDDEGLTVVGTLGFAADGFTEASCLEIAPTANGTEYAANSNFAGDYFVAFRFKVVTLPSARGSILVVGTTVGSQSTRLTIGTDGTLQMMDSSSALVGLASSPLSTGQWYHIQFHARKNSFVGSDGVMAFKVNDVLVSEVTGANVSTSASSVYFGSLITVASTGSPVYRYCDVVIDHNDWPGMLRVMAQFPNEDIVKGATVTTEPSGGTIWQQVDDNPQDGDTTYARLVTTAELSAVGFPDLPSTVAAVRGVDHVVVARHEGSAAVGQWGYYAADMPGSMDAQSFSVVTTYDFDHLGFVRNPYGQWTNQAMNNMGAFLALSGSNPLRITQFMRYVAFVYELASTTPPAPGGKPGPGKGQAPNKPKNRPLIGVGGSIARKLRIGSGG